MIFIAGAGAMADAAAAMRRQQRQINNRIRLTRLRAKARRAGPRLGEDYEPEQTDFECAHLCPTCEYFVRPDDDREVPDEPCPACGDDQWIDLSLETLADRLRNMEAEHRDEAPRFVQLLVPAIALALVAVAAIGVVVASIVAGG